jgi:hypothetical protein
MGLVVLAFARCGSPPKPAPVVVQDCRGARVWHQDDSARFRGCQVIEGKLELGGALQSAEDFASLVELRGDLVIGPSYQLDNLAALGKLQRIGGSLLVVDNMQLRGVFLGALRELALDLRISGNAALENVSLNRLRSIGGKLDLQRANRALERVDLGALETLGGAPLENDWQKALPEAVLRAPVY